MISPIHIITIGLGVAFSLGILNKLGKDFSAILMLLAIASMGLISFQWLNAILAGSQGVEIFTAGFKPPFSINLLMGKYEAIFTSLINVAGLLGGVYMYKTLKQQGTHSMMVYLIFIMALNVIIMTRDVFNLFVFLEVTSIATAGLIILDTNSKSIQAGFKYMIATSIIAGILLLGIIFAYNFTGSLNLADLSDGTLAMIKGGSVAVFMILIAIILELKPFPANGWALDVYEAADPGLGAMISAASATAMLFVLYKIMELAGESWYPVVASIGAITFFASNWLGIKQSKARRMLSYSSVGQIGLLMIILGLKPYLGDNTAFIAFTILISHYLAKAGLFWLSGLIKGDTLKDWAALRKQPLLLVLFGTFIFALIGFPPFPSFFGKWELIMQLSSNGMFSWIAVILIGSFLEGVYLFRWLGYSIKLDFESLPELDLSLNRILPPAIFAVSAYIAGYYAGGWVSADIWWNYIPLLFIVFLFVIDFLPAYIKNTISIAGILYYFIAIYPDIADNTLKIVFETIFLIGGVLTLIAGYAYKGKRQGFFPFALMMYAGLTGLIESETTLQFFFSWELMTLGSYFLIIRGKRSMPHAYSYMLFSIGGAYLILAGFGIAFFNNDSYSMSILGHIPLLGGWAYSMLAIGFMTKMASIGLHIWLPGAHAEAESDVSPMVSGILLKGGVFGLIVLFLYMGAETAGDMTLPYILGWVGAITALGGNMLAAFQEDAKRLLAYSSVGNLGYILFALALMTHVGWLTAMTYSINHFMFKTLLFLAIGGVVWRVKTHNMYEMGGLIKQMPFSFVAVLVGIITLAGIPPLVGYAGKWLIYNAVIAKGWYFQGTIVFFAGTIAFLYCFKLIYAVFLGQPKDHLRKVKEAPIWFIIPQMLLVIGIIIFSARPDLFLKPIGNMLSTSGYFPTDALTWDQATASSDIGYWSGYKVMMVIGIMFAILLLWLWLMSRKAQKVKQFNIVYAAERPFLPETTHFAHNMYAHLNKSLGFLVAPLATDFWNFMDNTVHSIADFTRKLYTGNGQTYVLHLIIYTVIVYFLSTGGF